MTMMLAWCRQRVCTLQYNNTILAKHIWFFILIVLSLMVKPISLSKAFGFCLWARSCRKFGLLFSPDIVMLLFSVRSSEFVLQSSRPAEMWMEVREYIIRLVYQEEKAVPFHVYKAFASMALLASSQVGRAICWYLHLLEAPIFAVPLRSGYNLLRLITQIVTNSVETHIFQQNQVSIKCSRSRESMSFSLKYKTNMKNAVI